MKPWNSWVAHLGMAGVCLLGVGCGGGKATSPEADSQAANDATPAPLVRPADDAPAKTEAASAEPATTTEPVAEAKTETPSATTEMLALGNAKAPAGSDSGSGAGGGSNASSTPGGSAGSPPPSGGSGGSAGIPGPTGGSAAPSGGSGGPNTNSIPAAPPTGGSGGSNTSTMPPTTPPPGGGSGGPNTNSIPPPTGGSGGPGMDPAALAQNRAALGNDFVPFNGDQADPAGGGAKDNFTTAFDATSSFLAALKSKNLSRIAEATALHAPTEASGKNQKLFAAILDQSLSDEDLDEFVKNMDGYQIVGMNQPKSTGRIGITLAKAEGTSQMLRTVTVRHEKKGWKVVDISPRREIEKPIVMPRMRGMGGMGGHRR